LKSLPKTEGFEEPKCEFLDYLKNLNREEIQAVPKHIEQCYNFDFACNKVTRRLRLVMRNSDKNILIEVKNGKFKKEEKILESEDDITYTEDFLSNT
jgi:hypothetical protein